MNNINGYRLIKEHYGNKRAYRSNVPLINHIDEGLVILNELNASISAKSAYCLHPIFQEDAELKLARNNFDLTRKMTEVEMMLVMEYRNIANAYLSTRDINSIDEIALSPLEEVNTMLIADKIQNRKDFEIYHKGQHVRSNELEQYFRNWFLRLEITDEFYQDMLSKL